MGVETDTKKARGARPYVFTDLLRLKGLEDVLNFMVKNGGLA